MNHNKLPKSKLIPEGGNDACIYRGSSLTCVDKYNGTNACERCEWNPDVEQVRKKALYR